MGGSGAMIAATGVQMASGLASARQQQAVAQYNSELSQRQAQYNAALTRKEAQYNARMSRLEAETQARLAEQQIDRVTTQEEVNTERVENQGAQTVAQQRVGFAKGNVQVDSGSSQQVQESTISEVNKDIALIRYGADLERYDLRTSADLARIRGQAESSMALDLAEDRARLIEAGGQAESGYYDMEADGAMKGGLMDAIDTGVSSYAHMKNEGMIE